MLFSAYESVGTLHVASTLTSITCVMHVSVLMSATSFSLGDYIDFGSYLRINHYHILHYLSVFRMLCDG